MVVETTQLSSNPLALSAQFLTLNPDLLYLIGGYLDLRSKYHLKQVNLQTFSPIWPIFLCEYPLHLTYIRLVLPDRAEIFDKRYYSVCDEESRCTRCLLLACLACADYVSVQACDVCGIQLCLSCQKQTGLAFFRCTSCGRPICVTRQLDQTHNSICSSSRKRLRDVTCERCCWENRTSTTPLLQEKTTE
jgi:hypothetical protein